MWSSKAGSKKQTHSFRCEDQISPNHKKKLQDRTNNNNNFVIREIPIKKFFNVEHCANNNANRDFSDFGEGKNYSATGMNGTDYDTPELVVFIQEDRHQQYVKDICIDRRISPERKCDINERSDLNLGIMETMSNNSFRPNCASQHHSFKEAMKVHGFRNLMKSEMELSLGDRFSIEHHHLTKKTTSETLREAFKRERNLTRSFENWQRNSILGTSGSRAGFPPHCRNCLQMNDINMYRPDISYLQSLATISEQRKIDYSQEISNNVSESQSGSTQCICHAKNSSIDSIGSANSFSFPILPVEWVGSPVKMMEADRSQSRKAGWGKIWLPCCCD
ncbi:unnamed protein product [Lathyrus sativus]|nr:unnamed protein product [Lathyrus sativus]